MVNDMIISGIIPVNGGSLTVFENNIIEILGPELTGHSTPMVVLYITEREIKTALVYSGVNNITMYKYKTHKELQHYWSHNYLLGDILKSKKYGNAARAAIRAYDVLIRHRK